MMGLYHGPSMITILKRMSADDAFGMRAQRVHLKLKFILVTPIVIGLDDVKELRIDVVQSLRRVFTDVLLAQYRHNPVILRRIFANDVLRTVRRTIIGHYHLEWEIRLLAEYGFETTSYSIGMIVTNSHNREQMSVCTWW